MRRDEYEKRLQEYESILKQYQDQMEDAFNDGLEAVQICNFIRTVVEAFAELTEKLDSDLNERMKELEEKCNQKIAQERAASQAYIEHIKNSMEELASKNEILAANYSLEQQKIKEESLQKEKEKYEKRVRENDSRIKLNISLRDSTEKPGGLGVWLGVSKKKMEEYTKKVTGYQRIIQQNEEDNVRAKEEYEKSKRLLDSDFAARIKNKTVQLERETSKARRESERKVAEIQVQKSTAIEKANKDHEYGITYEKSESTRQKRNLEVWTQKQCQNFFANKKFVSSQTEKQKSIFRFAEYLQEEDRKKNPQMIDCGYWLYDPEKNKMGIKVSKKIWEYMWRAAENMVACNESTVLKFPNIHKTECGKSLYLDMNTSENKKYIRSLVLADLMQYPAGRLNLIMIDPRTSGCFGGFARLGDDDADVIDSSVWSNMGDIQSAISRLKGRMGQLINRYGNETKKCREKENHNLLIAVDFPQGFGLQALDDLEIILEKGREYGVSVIIAQNDQVMASEQRSDKEQELIKRIKAKMLIMQKNGEDYGIWVKNSKPYFLAHILDMMFFETRADQIIRHVEEKLRYRTPDILEPDEVWNIDQKKNRSMSDTTENGIEIPFGTKGVNDIGKLVLGRTDVLDIRQHVLIEGMTGGGKSSLLHALIISAITKYSPEELQLYLLDFKDGVGFKVYADYELPSIRVVSTRTEREFGRCVFEMLVEEQEYRAQLFKNASTDERLVENISDYRKWTGKQLPMLLLIVDEFETLLGKDELSEEIMRCLEILVKQGRAAGIHIILSSQNLNLPTDVSSQMGIRIAVKGAKNILASDNQAVSLIKANQAVLNDNCGDKSRNEIISVMYVKNELRAHLRELSQKQKAMRYESKMDFPRRVLYTNIQDSQLHPYNRMISEGKWIPGEPFRLGAYVAEAGEGYGLSWESLTKLEFQKKKNCGLLVVTGTGKLAARILSNVLLGLLYSDQKARKSKFCKTVTVIDLDSRRGIRYRDECLAETLAKILPDRMSYYSKEQELKKDTPFEAVRKVISEIYNQYLHRKKGDSVENRIFLMIIGMENIKIMDGGSIIYDEWDENSTLGMVMRLIEDGAEYGIHMIVSTSDFALMRDVYGNGCEQKFAFRVAAGVGETLMKVLVSETRSKEFNENTGVFYNTYTGERNRFRIMEEPGAEWLCEFGKALKSCGTKNKRG